MAHTRAVAWTSDVDAGQVDDQRLLLVNEAGVGILEVRVPAGLAEGDDVRVMIEVSG